MRLALLLVGVVACTPVHRTVPVAPHEASDHRLVARVVRLELPEDRGLARADLEVQNRGGRPVQLAKSRLKYVGLVEPAPVTDSTGAAILRGSAAAGVGAGRATARGVGRLGSGGGGALGLAVGIVVAAAILAPVGLGYLVYLAATYEPVPDVLQPGQRTRLRIDVTPPAPHRAQHVALGLALDDGRQPFDVPVVDVTQRHGGWQRPRRLDQVGFRIGGGPILGDGAYSGTGGIQFLARRRVGPLLVGGHVSALGVDLGVGPEIGLPFALPHGIEVTATLDGHAGYTLVGATWVLSPTVGVEAAIPIQYQEMLGWAVPGASAGLYAKAGPAWIDAPGTYGRVELGVVFR